MTRFLSASLAILSAATTVSAFSPSHHQSVFRSYGTSTTSTYATEDTDFDAPIPAYPMSGTAVLGKKNYSVFLWSRASFDLV